MSSLFIYYSAFIITIIFLYFGYKRPIIIHKCNRLIKSSDINNDTIRIIISLIPIIYLLTNRYMVGTDYIHYERMYYDYVKYSYINFEYGLVVLFKLSDMIGLGFKGFLFFSVLLGPVLSIVAINRQCNCRFFPIAVFTYLIIYFGPACNIIAQVIAISFVILAYEQMLKRNWKFSIILSILGCFFHFASIIVIPVYWAYNLEGRTRVKFISIISIIIAGFFTLNPSLLSRLLIGIGLNRYSNYAQYEKIKTFSYLLLYRTPLILMELIFYRRLIFRSKNNQFYFFLVILEIASFVLGIGISWAGRLAYFFSIAHIFLVVKILEVTRDSRIRIIISILINFYLVFVFYMMYFFSEFDGITVYQFA